MEDIKKTANGMKGNKEKLSYLEEQLKKTKDKSMKEIIKKMIVVAKKRESSKPKEKKSLEEKVENKNIEAPAIKQVAEDTINVAEDDKKYRVVALESAAENIRTRTSAQKEKSYASQRSYGSSFSDYKVEMRPTMYEEGTRSALREIEDNFIKDGILTPGRMPTTDQIDVIRDRLKKINPGASDESLIFYERNIV